jgi:hypothetical protein
MKHRQAATKQHKDTKTLSVHRDIPYIIAQNAPTGFYFASIRLPDNHPFIPYLAEEGGFLDLPLVVPGDLTFGQFISDKEGFPHVSTPGYWLGWDYWETQASPATVTDIERDCQDVIDQVLETLERST